MSKQWIILPVLLYLAITNATAFLLMGFDKRRARKQVWRIPEKTLFTAAFLGGSMGAIIGMEFFHHKTRHLTFKIGLPLLFICQIVFCIFLIMQLA